MEREQQLVMNTTHSLIIELSFADPVAMQGLHCGFHFFPAPSPSQRTHRKLPQFPSSRMLLLELLLTMQSHSDARELNLNELPLIDEWKFSTCINYDSRGHSMRTVGNPAFRLLPLSHREARHGTPRCLPQGKFKC